MLANEGVRKRRRFDFDVAEADRIYRDAVLPAALELAGDAGRQYWHRKHAADPSRYRWS